MKPEPFRIAIPQERLDRLKHRLNTADWADDFGNEDWRYGMERGWLRDMADYWANTYDWRATEARMNGYEQFMVEMDGVPVHFMRMKGKGPNPFPLILSHGWPWTFWDYEQAALRLSDPAAFGGDPADAFDVIVPSLPGYGFSSPLRENGYGSVKVARLWARLMRDVLGYGRWGAAGGDWGARVTAQLGEDRPEGLQAVYMTLPILPGVNPLDIPAADYAEDEKWMLDRLKVSVPTIAAHLAVHRLDPQTMAYGLQDSPLGLAAWIWNRRRAWSDCDGDAIALYGRDFLCDLVSIYWLTGTIGTSMRSYVFNMIDAPSGKDGPRIETPTGYGVARKDVVMLPRSWAEARTNLRRWQVIEKGGHFLPAEQPDIAAAEYRTFFADFR